MNECVSEQVQKGNELRKCLKLKLVIGLYITGWGRISPEAQRTTGKLRTAVRD
jgi:hypothetical protein